MTELFAWIAFPALLIAVSCGVGLLVAVGLNRGPGPLFNATLVPPLGMAAAIVLVVPVYTLGGGWVPAAVLLLLATAAGFVLGRDRLAELRPGAGAAAGGLVYGLYMAPVVLTGDATFLGYNLLNDTSIHLLLVEHLAQHGDQMITLEPSTIRATLEAYIGKSYPLGSHELLATLQAPLGAEPARIYQPFIAVSGAFAAAALVAIVRGLGIGRWVAAGVAALAMGGQLIYSFNLQGGIKEIGFVAVLATAAALVQELLRSEHPERAAVLVAIPAAAAFEIYGLSALAWLGPLALGAAIWFWAARGARPLAVPLAVAAVAFLVLSAPAIPGAIEFYDEGKSDLTSESELGPLVGPLRDIQVTGVWLKGDYRQLPDSGGRWSFALGGFVLVMAVFGLGLALRRRGVGAALFLLPALLAWLVVSGSSSPYIDAKLLAVLSPAVVLMAGLGVAGLWAARRPEAVLAGALLVGAIVFSDALAYRQAAPAPMDRLMELDEIGERFATDDLMLVNEYEDFAKTYLRESRAVVPYDGLSPFVRPRNPEPEPAKDDDALPVKRVYTLDELTFNFVSSFERIVVRRSPGESRPPAGFERVYEGDFYEVWDRTSELAKAHLPAGKPESHPWSAASELPCTRLRKFGRRATLVAATAPEAVLFDVTAHRPLPEGWKRARPEYPLALDAGAGGVVSAEATAEAGTYRIWLRGHTYRDVEVVIDGGRAGIARGDNGPGQWIEVGRVTLDAGTHTVELKRPRRSLAPGDGRSDIIGPVVAVPEQPEPRLSSAGDGDDLCGQSVDWVERR